MSLQEPQEQFERETEEPLEDLQENAPNEAPPSDSDEQESSNESEPVTVPSTGKLPQSSDTSLHTEGVDGPAWYVVRNTPGVTGFVGMGNTPTPLRPEEVSQIIKRMEADAPTVKVTFKVGERVRIIDGPFNDFRGVVSEIDMERTKVRVMVSFFGRETPVELDFLQVEKA